MKTTKEKFSKALDLNTELAGLQSQLAAVDSGRMSITRHRDGTVSYTLDGVKVKRAPSVPRSHLDALPYKEARRIALHLASRKKNLIAQAGLDDKRPAPVKGWSSTPNDLRNRPNRKLTLPDTVWEELTRMAKEQKISRSVLVERMTEDMARSVLAEQLIEKESKQHGKEG